MPTKLSIQEQSKKQKATSVIDVAFCINKIQQGADKGNANCLYSLGYLHYKGFGFPQDYAKAIQLFELASEKRNATAMYMLGLCYRNGYGVTIDTEKAKYWLNKSAALGSQIALICNKHPLADSAELHSVPTKLSRQYKSKKSYIYQKRYSFFVFKRISLVVI